jgi:CheY-like chemotaxis protein
MTINKVTLSAPLKFLVVDDSRAIQAIIKRAISNCGFEPIEIQTAADGGQALDVLENFTPDLIITDWHMPKVSGLELLQALRQMGHKKMRVGFVTTEKTPALLEEAINNGALFILHKPFEDAELVELVTAAVMDLAKLLMPAAPTPVVTTADQPVPTDVLQKLITERLGNLPFRLIANRKMVKENLTTNNLLGLYSRVNHKGVYVIGVMDANTVCMLGGGSARQTPMEVRTAMASGQPTELMLTKATEFLRMVAPCMAETAGDAVGAVTLAKSSVVKNTFAKLNEVLNQPHHRSDFRLSIPGYGEGFMAFFVMTP